MNTLSSLKYYRSGAIDYMRFYMCMLICLVHILHMILMHFSPSFVCTRLNAIPLSVESFFILSGFFISISTKRTIASYVKAKISRLWPIFAISIGTAGLLYLMGLSPIPISFGDVANLLFLQGTGLYQECGTNGPAWYVGVLFWVGLVLIVWKDICSKMPIIAGGGALIICAISMYLLWNGENEVIYSNARGYIANTCLSIMLVRGFAAMSLGYILGLLQKYILGRRFELLRQQHPRMLTFIIIVLFIVYSLIVLFCGNLPLGLNYCFVIGVFSVITIVYFNGNIPQTRVSNLAGQWSYSIYMMQNCVFFLVPHVIMVQKDFFIKHNVITVTMCMLIFVVFGIMADYINNVLNSAISQVYSKLGLQEKVQFIDTIRKRAKH